MARASGSVSACTQIPANRIVVDRISKLDRSFISSPVIRPRLGHDAQIVVRGTKGGQGIGRSYSERVRDRGRGAASSRSNPLKPLSAWFEVASQCKASAVLDCRVSLVSLPFKDLSQQIMGFECRGFLDRSLG